MSYRVLSIWIFIVAAFSLTSEAQTISFPAETCNKTSVDEKLNESFSSADLSGDTLQIHSEGTSNTIMIDSTSIAKSRSPLTIKGVVGGEINQEGESNKIEVDISNKNKNHSGQKVKIIQTGKNNSVTIRSGANKRDP
ncbi:MAG: hypothetical protein WD426_20880 [Anditalea sp.]